MLEESPCLQTDATRGAGATGLGETKQSHCVDDQNKTHLKCAAIRGRKRNEALHPAMQCNAQQSKAN
jgi:hypothetical protein